MQTSDVPILFLVFNRPEPTARVFAEIRKQKPKRLFVAADGPRPDRPNEPALCAEVRQIVTAIDWDCKLETRFLDTNWGCRKGISSSISWFFENVEAGIILEDDCVPDPTFFSFCAELLTKYDDDPEVVLISGDNFQNGIRRGNASYYFSHLPHIWGWATWRRAWKQFDVDLTDEQAYRDAIKLLHDDPVVHQYWTNILEMSLQRKVDSWGYPFFFSVLRQRGLCVVPNVNMVSNIGFGPDATHTFQTDCKQANIPAKPVKRLLHPRDKQVCQEADNYSLKNVFGIQISEPVAERKSFLASLGSLLGLSTSATR